jgi:nucleotide-binding universal stress UspA family protein
MAPVASGSPIICAVEDTEAARHAARASKWLASALEAPLVLAHVFDPMGIAVPPIQDMVAASVSTEDLEHAARGRALRHLDELARSLGDGEVATELPEDMPVPGLLDLATARGARLIVTGTAARTGLDRVLIGSVSSEVAARAPCPVIAVARGAAIGDPGPVLVGYDGSEHSLRAGRHAVALAAELRREVVLMHVVGREGSDLRLDRELAGDLHAAARGALGASGTRRLELKVNLATEQGDPVEVLARAGRERAAALIVLGTRGRNALSSALLGSVGAGLVHAAERPVGLVPESAGDGPPPAE